MNNIIKLTRKAVDNVPARAIWINPEHIVCFDEDGEDGSRVTLTAHQHLNTWFIMVKEHPTRIAKLIRETNTTITRYYF